MIKRRQLRFLFQDPGMLEAIAEDPAEVKKNHVASRGYSDSPIPDLMVDFRKNASKPFAWISYNFHKTYPAVIWGLKLLMADELFDVPQAGLSGVPLYEAFSWAYAHFLWEDEMPTLTSMVPGSFAMSRQVLQYAATVA